MPQYTVLMIQNDEIINKWPVFLLRYKKQMSKVVSSSQAATLPFISTCLLAMRVFRHHVHLLLFLFQRLSVAHHPVLSDQPVGLHEAFALVFRQIFTQNQIYEFSSWTLIYIPFLSERLWMK